MDGYHHSSHAVYRLQFHLILVTKYRRPVLVGEVEEALKKVCSRLISENFESGIIEMECDKDHIHLLIDLSTKYSIAEVVNTLKGVTSRILRRDYGEEIRKQLWGDSLWSDSYFAASTGGVTLEVLKQYVQKQPDRKRKPGRPTSR